MGAIGGKIRARFDGGALATKTAVHVPEWDVTLYVGPWTWGQAMAVENAARMESLDFLREVIKVKGKKEDGSPALDAEDYDILKDFGEAEVVNRVGTEILEAFPLDFKKKS